MRFLRHVLTPFSTSCPQAQPTSPRHPRIHPKPARTAQRARKFCFPRARRRRGPLLEPDQYQIYIPILRGPQNNLSKKPYRECQSESKHWTETATRRLARRARSLLLSEDTAAGGVVCLQYRCKSSRKKAVTILAPQPMNLNVKGPG